MAYTREKFIEKAEKVHGFRYIYEKVIYTGSQKKVVIVCPEHGEFQQTPSAHLRGDGCPKCANERRGKRDTRDGFIINAIMEHGEKYDYSKVTYKNSSTKVCIVCPKHGEFWQTPASHLSGKGCPKCSGVGLSGEEIISRFRYVHGKVYDYSRTKFGRMSDKVEIICPEHGSFWQAPSKHLLGQGCPKCGKEKSIKKQILDTEEFIARSNVLYGKTYDYSKVNYKRADTKVEIICKKHGSFFQRPYDHLQGHGCPVCGKLNSKPEEEIYKYILSLVPSEGIIRNDRTVLNGKEIDILLTYMKLGIEFNGLKWHNEKTGRDKNYHIGKLQEANDRGIKLMQIFEDEYNTRKEIVLKKIGHAILKTDNSFPKIMARKCTVSLIDCKEARNFLENHHIQGYGKCTYSIGCFYGERLIGVMSFKREKDNNWELVRFASHTDYVCQGVGGKLFKYFLRKEKPNIVKSFADRRWTVDTENNLYTKIGFVKDKVLKPDYRYINIENPTVRIHKSNFRKKKLSLKYGLPMTMTESQMAEKLGYAKIWDCGLIRYKYKNGEH